MNAADPVRQLAFDEVLLLPGAGEHNQGVAAEAMSRLEAFPPEQRSKALNIAARRLAFQLLYQLDVSAAETAQSLVGASLAAVEGLGPILADQVGKLAVGAFEGRGAADEEFRRLAPEWPTHRQAAVDRAILRLAHFEMTAGLTAPKIVMSEAVELARHFSTDKSPAFINGLLDKVYRRISPEAGKAE